MENIFLNIPNYRNIQEKEFPGIPMNFQIHDLNMENIGVQEVLDMI